MPLEAQQLYSLVYTRYNYKDFSKHDKRFTVHIFGILLHRSVHMQSALNTDCTLCPAPILPCRSSQIKLDMWREEMSNVGVFEKH